MHLNADGAQYTFRGAAIEGLKVKEMSYHFSFGRGGLWGELPGCQAGCAELHDSLRLSHSLEHHLPYMGDVHLHSNQGQPSCMVSCSCCAHFAENVKS